MIGRGEPMSGREEGEPMRGPGGGQGRGAWGANEREGRIRKGEGGKGDQ